MAAINKNFVIKNGLEVDTNLIFADAYNNKVGIGTTNPQYTLHVNGGIGVTNAYVSGITTVINELRVGTGGTIFSVIAGPAGVGQSVGVGTARPAFLLDVRSPVSTGQTALYVQGDVRVTGDLNIDDISITNLNVSGVSTFVGFATFNNNILVAGIGTITNLVSTSGTITNLTGTSGTITTFNSTTGNITNLTNTNLNVTGIATIATLNATGIAVTNFTVYNNLSVGGISTFTNGPVLIGSGTSTGTASQRLQVTGGTYVSGNLGIGSTNPTSALFVVGDARVTGVITATTFSGNVNAGVGTITTLGSTNATIANLTGTSGTITTFNSTNGTITNLTGTAGTITTLNSTNGTITNLNVTGISTLGTVKISSGIITATSGIVTYFGDGSNLTGLAANPTLQTVLNTGNTSTIGMSIVGVVTATSFVGSGASLTGLTGAGSTVFIDTTTNQEFFPLFTATTSGTITASGISTSKLTYNPSTGAMTAVDFNSTSDINLKENIHTVGNALEITEQLRGVSFDWKETGRSSYGVIAQELEEVLPELVKKGEVKSVNYNGIIGVLIEAIKELKKEVEDLKNTK